MSEYAWWLDYLLGKLPIVPSHASIMTMVVRTTMLEISHHKNAAISIIKVYFSRLGSNELVNLECLCNVAPGSR